MNCFKLKRLAFLLTALILAPSPLFASTDTLIQSFQAMHGKQTWPVSGSTYDDIESSFGPRIKASTKAYDWHRGIDIDAPLGTPVLAAYDGTLWNVTYYSDGGTTVVLKHTFPTPLTFQGKSLPYFYTLYMHLNEVEASLIAANAKKEKPIVKAGTTIGTVGHSGNGAFGDHLHFEIRVGTQCSLEYQLENPNSSCSKGFGFDPHVHPLLLFPNQSPQMNLTIESELSNSQNGTVRITMPDDQPTVNRATLEIIDDSAQSLSYSKTLDFNNRTGFNANTNAALDTVDTTTLYVSPETFGNSSNEYATRFIVPATLAITYPTSAFVYKLTVMTIWGANKTIIVSQPSPEPTPTAVSNKINVVVETAPPVQNPQDSVTSADTIITVATKPQSPSCNSKGSLIKLPNDGNPLTHEDSTVYYYGADCKRHAFTNSSVYFTWYQNFSSVQEVLPQTLASMPLGSNITYRPGVKLIKFETDPKVYAVSTNGILRWITSESLAQNLYGTKWNVQIDTLSDALYLTYSFGASILQSGDYNPETERMNAQTID